jgi:hypothetical protein
MPDEHFVCEHQVVFDQGRDHQQTHDPTDRLECITGEDFVGEFDEILFRVSVAGSLTGESLKPFDFGLLILVRLLEDCQFAFDARKFGRGSRGPFFEPRLYRFPVDFLFDDGL